MKIKSLQIFGLTLGTTTLSLLLSACGTTSGYQQADKTGAGIADFRSEIVNGKRAIDATMKSLSEVAATANTDPRKAFNRFSKDLADLESTAAKVRKHGQRMKEEGAAYFTQWETQLGQVSNPDIRALAQQRRTKLQETFDSVRKYTEPLKAQFDPWMSDLKDLEKYLSNDLTISGVDAAKSMLAKTTSEGLDVQKSMDALVAELNTIAATITPARNKAK